MKKQFLIGLSLIQSSLFGLTTQSPFTLISASTTTNQNVFSPNNGTPILAVSINGNALAAWVNFPNNIQTAYYVKATNTWTFNGTLTEGTAPQIGIDKDGNALIVWVTVGTVGPATKIMASRLTFTATTGAIAFSTPVEVSTVGTNFGPSLVVNDNGLAMVVWIQNAPYQINGATFNPTTSTWSVPTAVFVTNGSPNGTYPAVFGLDNITNGIALFNIKGSIQASRITTP